MASCYTDHLCQDQHVTHMAFGAMKVLMEMSGSSHTGKEPIKLQSEYKMQHDGKAIGRY
jgi:hypothetical protein